MLAGNNPLRGPNDGSIGDRFPPVSDAYDPVLQSMIVSIAESLSLGHLIHQDGIYCYVSGPAYESKAGMYHSNTNLVIDFVTIIINMVCFIYV